LTPPSMLPSLSDVLSRVLSLLVDDVFLADVFFTVRRWLSGFILGVMAGTLIGLCIGHSVRLRTLLEFSIEFLRAIPVTAIFPLFLLTFGIGDSSKVAMAFLPTFLLMLVSTSYGVTLVEPARKRMAKAFGASPRQIFWRVTFMDALPQIFVGVRISLSQSLIVTVVSEMFIGTEFGLGQRVYESYLINSVNTLYSILIWLGLIGYIVNKGTLSVERKLVFWAGK
jgi:sulfonate transport system permease protein